MCSLKEYSEKIKVKTLFVFCNDCHCKHELVSNPKFLVATSLGNMVTHHHGLGEGYLDYCVKKEGIRQVIIVGHYQCQVLDFIRSKTSLDNSIWAAAKFDLQHVETLLKPSIKNQRQKDKKIIQHYIALQMLNFSLEPSFKALEKTHGISIGGIIIDEERRNEVLEINKSIAVHLPLSLN